MMITVIMTQILKYLGYIPTESTCNKNTLSANFSIERFVSYYSKYTCVAHTRLFFLCVELY